MGGPEERQKLRFVEEKEYTPKFMIELAEKFADVATITTAGDVSIKHNCSVKDKVATVAIARFLGNKLRDIIKAEIKAEVTREEVARYADTDKITASARLKDFVDKGLLDRLSPGVFRVRSLTQAEKWVNILCKKYLKTKR